MTVDDRTDVPGTAARLGQLAANSALFRALVEHSGDAIKMIDADGRVLYASPSAVQVLGFQPAVGTTVFDLVHPDDRALLQEELRRCVEQPGVPRRAETRYRDSTGGWRTIEVVRVSHLDNPEVGAIVTNHRDVTGRKALERQLVQAQKMETVGLLAGAIAHDFNNVLTVILSVAHLARADLPGEDRLAQELGQIIRAAERAEALTRQLLAFSRKQFGDPILLSLSSILVEMEVMLRRVLGSPAELTLDLAPDERLVRADPSHMEQVILNLVVNARDALGGRRGSVLIETRNVTLQPSPARERAGGPQAGDYVLMAVVDDGCGMDDDVRARIFEPFFSTKPPGKGTGLGLPTVLGIVQQSGGHLMVQSEPGKGTRFEMLLPVA